MDRTAIVIGLPETCASLQKQLDLLGRRPRILGWVIAAGTPVSAGCDVAAGPVLGDLRDLETIVDRLGPDLGLVTLPAAMSDLIVSVRTRLRRLEVPDRFMPTLRDQLEGVGPRSRIEIDLAALLGRPPRHIDDASIRRAVRGRRVLITGAGGTIGGELARLVCRYDPQQLALVDRSENALFEIDRQVARLAPELARRAVLHDVVDPEGTRAHVAALRPHILFHAAAHKHVPMMEDHPAAAVDNNLFGTRSVADAADRCGAERFVMISTDKAVNPRSIMGATKRLAEMYIQHLAERSGTVFSMVRFGNVLGSTGSVLDVWSREVAEGGPLTVTHPHMTRYFMTVAEAAALVVQSVVLADSSCSGTVFLLDMGKPVRVLDLAHRFARLHGLEPVVAPTAPPLDCGASVRIVFTGPRQGEKLHEELLREGDAVAPTAHPDIRELRPPPPEPQRIEQMLRDLSPPCRPAAAASLRRLVRELASPSVHEPTAA
jgi:FlaA1/EpsC-like NDP-sugar epimerase